MEFNGMFLPTAGQLGLLPLLTWYFMVVTAFAFLANVVFSLATLPQIRPEHRESSVYSAAIALVAGLSYWLMQDYYRRMLAEAADLPDATLQYGLYQTSYSAIGQLRYMDWAVTTPLLLLKMLSMLRLRFAEAPRAFATLLASDVFMVVTGYIGEQQLAADGSVLVGAKLLWGAISTVGYVFIPLTLWRVWQQFGSRAEPAERWAFRLMALSTGTVWGVYPLGYVLTTFDVSANVLHIAFSLADIVNKVGVAVVAYQATVRPTAD